MVDDMPFSLAKEVSAVTLSYDGAVWNIFPFASSSFGVGNNWEVITNSQFLSREVLDLGGLSSEERTLFFASQMIQRAGPYLSDVTVDPILGGVEVYDVLLVSDVPLNDPVTIASSGSPNARTAGFSNSADEPMNIKFGRGQTFAQASTLPLTMTNADTWNFGSGNPTASDSLYIYRYIEINADAAVLLPNNAVGIPSIRYIANGITTQESDLVYINRLRVSYEQQQRI